jgi:hypothetical protein
MARRAGRLRSGHQHFRLTIPLPSQSHPKPAAITHRQPNQPRPISSTGCYARVYLRLGRGGHQRQRLGRECDRLDVHRQRVRRDQQDVALAVLNTGRGHRAFSSSRFYLAAILCARGYGREGWAQIPGVASLSTLGRGAGRLSSDCHGNHERLEARYASAPVTVALAERVPTPAHGRFGCKRSVLAGSCARPSRGSQVA